MKQIKDQNVRIGWKIGVVLIMILLFLLLYYHAVLYEKP